VFLYAPVFKGTPFEYSLFFCCHLDLLRPLVDFHPSFYDLIETKFNNTFQERFVDEFPLLNLLEINVHMS